MSSQEDRSTPESGGIFASRRSFLKRALAGATVGSSALLHARGAMATIGAGEKAGSTAEPASIAPSPEAFAEGNALERMRVDLHRAMQKPVADRRWGMVIDLRKCINCRACTVSCVAENALPPGVVYRPVMSEEIGSFPNVRMKFLPRPCMQCENPPCVPPCPVGATYKRPDGVVVVDYEQCIGCRYCISSCPYGARSFDFSEFHEEHAPRITDYETRPNYEYGREHKRVPENRTASPMGNARKCHFCLHRVHAGILPGCVTTCLGGATSFGDLNDPDSLVSRLSASEHVTRLKSELGTSPKVYYLT